MLWKGTMATATYTTRAKWADPRGNPGTMAFAIWEVTSSSRVVPSGYSRNRETGYRVRSDGEVLGDFCSEGIDQFLVHVAVFVGYA